MSTRFLNPSVLMTLSGLELVAKSVVDGFVAGLHRSPDFGFSQEFAEYRMYTPGDDLRHVDWNVFARTERAYLKRYRGETNSQLLLMIDVSRSMAFASHGVSKLEYAKFLTSSLAYLGQQQRDASGVLIFDDDVKQFVPPSSRQGQLHRVLHAIERAEPGIRTDYAKPFLHVMNLVHRRGIVVLVSDFYGEPEQILKAIEPLRAHGSEVVLFHLMDPKELDPAVDDSTLIIDMESDARIEVSPAAVREHYLPRLKAHLDAMSEGARRRGMDYLLIDTSKPLDRALHEYLNVRQGRL